MTEKEFKSLKAGDILENNEGSMRWLVLEVKDGFIHYKNLNMPELGAFWYFYKVVFPSGSFNKVYQIEGFEV